MGDTQSAQKRDAAEEEEGAHTAQVTEDKIPSNDEQISGMNGKADGAIAEVNGHFKDQVAAEAVAIPDEEDTTGTEQKDITESENLKPLKEEEPSLEKVDINEKETPDPKEEASPDNTDVDAKQNDINESFRRFFSSIGLKLTVKKGGGNAENAPDVLFETTKEEQNRPDDVEDTTDETKHENDEQNTDLHTAQETCDNDSTTCPTLTENTPEDIQENVEESNVKTTEASEEVASENTSALTTSQKGEEDATPEEDPDATSPSSHDEEVIVSPFKKFFSTGIFSGLRKKKKPANDENIEKGLVDMPKQETVVSIEETVQDQQLGKGEMSPGDEAAAAEMEHRQNEVKEEIPASTSTSAQTTDTPEMKENAPESKSPPREPSIVITNEAEILSSQEKIKVQGSPLKRLLSGSSFKKLSKKQRGRGSSESRLSDSGEHVSDQLLSSTESAGNHREESPAQPPAEAAEVEEGTWASFKKLVTPKKRVKRPSLTNEEARTAEEPKTSEGEQGSDHSTEEVRKQKDSSVSWEAVLCGSGRRRSRKTSDSEDEMAHSVKDDNKRAGESRQGTESPPERSNGASSLRQAESPAEGDGGSTWKSLKRLVTPKRKAKDEEESKDDNRQSDSEVTKDESSFSIKKLIPRRKKRKSADKQDQVSSDEADREAVSDDEDSDTPAVIPLSEFETDETEVLTETQAVIESHTDNEPREDVLGHVTEPLLPGDSLQAEAKKIQDNAMALENQTTTITASNEELEDLTDLSKHQQLSDIPEEGVIEETMATPASVTEEVARDDTIAEDLIEITSEAITAPEPVDITLTDETEMISAVSQLTESSKTSGNTTPVPAEYDMKATEVLLHQVVETISITPTTVLLCLNDPSLEGIFGSVSPQILETNVKDEATILERHRQSNATSIKTGLTAEELDAVHELAATAQTESLTEVKEAISTEVISAVTPDDIVTADITVDEVLQADVSQAQETMKEFESTDESQPLVEYLPKENKAMSTEQMSENEKIGADEVSIVESNQDEIQNPKSESQEADSTAVGIDETENENVEQEVRTELEKEDQSMENINDQVHAEDHDQVPQVPVVAEDLQTLTSVKATTLNSQEIGADVDVVNETENEAEESMHVQAVMASLEEDVPKPETDDIIASVIDNTVAGLDQTAESKKDKIIESTTDDTPQEVQVEAQDHIPEVVDDLQTLTAAHISVVHEEPSSVQVLEKTVVSEDIPAPCADNASTSVADEPIQEVHLTEVSIEGEKEGELPATEATTAAVEHAEVAEVTICGLKDVVAAIADTAIEQTPEMKEPLIETAAYEVEIKETMETVTLVMEMTKTTETAEASMHAVIHVPSVQFEDNHRIQVQVVDVDRKSAEAVVDTVLEVGVKQAKEIIYDCHGVDRDVQNLSPTLESEKEVTMSGAKDVIGAIPETEIDKVSEITEPLAEAVAYDVELNEAVEIVTPLMKMTNTAETAGSGAEVVTMHVPSVQFEDNHRIQVQVVDVSIKSAETALDTVLEVGLTQAKEIIYDCHGVDIDVQNLSPTLESEKEVTMSGAKDVIGAIPETEIDKVSEITEPLAEAVAYDVELNEAVEIVTPLMKMTNMAETAGSGGEVVTMHVPSVQFEDNHRIQVQVVDVSIKSAETALDTVLEVGLTQAKEIIYDCHGVDRDVQNLSPTLESEKEVTMSGAKDVIGAIPETEIDKVSEITEPLAEAVAYDVELNEAVEIVTPLMKMTNMAETAGSGGEVVTMHVPSVQFEDNHRIQVQVVDVSIKSAETALDTVLEVGLTQAKEIIYDCHGVDIDVQNLSPTLESEKEVTMSGAKDVIGATPETEIDKVSEITEPLAEAVAFDLELKEAVKIVTPLMKMTNTAETAGSGGEVVTTHVPSVQFEDNHRIQVQVVDVSIKSTETALDTVLEVGPTQAKEIVDVCHEMDNTVEDLFATLETEEEVMSEGSKVTIQEVIQQVKESLPKLLPETEAFQSGVQDELVNSEQEMINPPTAETEQSKMAESEFAEVEHQEVTEDATGTFGEIQVEDPAITSDNYAISTDREESQDQPEKFNSPVSSEIPIHDDKENLVETGAELTKSKVGITKEDVTSEEVPMKKMSDDDIVEAQRPQNAPSRIATPSNTGIVVPQNTGLISSIGNVESPSSLSLEFKLNIQFGHPKAPVSSSSHQVQVTEPVEPEQQISATERAEGQKQPEPTEAAVHVRQTIEPETKRDAQERAVTTSSPVLRDVGIQAVEAVEIVEQIEPVEKVILSIQATEARQPARRIETRKTAVVLSHPELLTETKAAEPVKQTEEEHEQDVWLDAEENINTKEETETVESLESQTESTCEHEWKTAESAHIQEGKSEGEDFAVAPEHSEPAAASITKMECD